MFPALTRPFAPSVISQCLDPPLRRAETRAGRNSLLFYWRQRVPGDATCCNRCPGQRAVCSAVQCVCVLACAVCLLASAAASAAGNLLLRVHRHIHTHTHRHHHIPAHPRPSFCITTTTTVRHRIASHRRLETWRRATVQPWGPVVPPCCSPAGGFTASPPPAN